MTRHDAIDRTAADRALERGIVFVRRQARVTTDEAWHAPGDLATRQRRVLANWLSELHRLYCVCLDGSGRQGVVMGDAGASAFRSGERDLARLHALKRTRETLYYTDGIVRRADRRGERRMSVGWYEAGTPRLVRVALGERIELRTRNLEDVCGFYERLALAGQDGSPRGDAESCPFLAGASGSGPADDGTAALRERVAGIDRPPGVAPIFPRPAEIAAWPMPRRGVGR